MDNDQLARQLLDGLTSEQLVGLLARLLDGVSETEWAEFCDDLDSDTGTVFLRLIESQPEAGTEDETDDLTSDARFAQQFRAAVISLANVVDALGDEDGDYVCQEHHWETPDFDAYQVAKDIEACAKELLPLIPRAAELELEEDDWFLDLCHDITDGIEMYPEYIYTEEGVCLERAATECVLTWLDLHVESEASFLKKLVEFMDTPGLVALDDGTVSTYLLEGWTENRRRALYHAIRDRRSSDEAFRDETDKPHMLWHKIRYALAGEFDAVGRIEIAEASVAEDWKKGVELVDAAVADGNQARALEFCRKTVSAYHCQRSFGREIDSFDPGITPLCGYRSMDQASPPLARILSLWADLAAKDGDVVLAEQLTVQKALFTRIEDWTAVKHAFAQAGSAETTGLFEDWKKLTLERQHGISYLGVGRRAAPVWPEWLIDAGFAGRFEAFTEKAMLWLAEKAEPKKKKALPGFLARRQIHDWPPQLSLTADLFSLDSAPEQYPTLKAMLAQHCKLSDCPARREWLGNTDVPRLTAGAVEFVRGNAAHLIPSPGSMNGDYESAAGWLAAAREVAPETARDTLRHWQDEYRRRRNLWRDLHAHGFDV